MHSFLHFQGWRNLCTFPSSRSLSTLPWVRSRGRLEAMAQAAGLCSIRHSRSGALVLHRPEADRTSASSEGILGPVHDEQAEASWAVAFHEPQMPRLSWSTRC